MNIAQSKQSAQRRLATVKSELTNTHRYYVKLLEKQRYLEKVREDLRAEEKALEQFLFPPEGSFAQSQRKQGQQQDLRQRSSSPLSSTSDTH